jgi:hypothetical protein
MRNNIVFITTLATVLLAESALADGPPAGRVVGWGVNYSGEATGVPTNRGLRAPNSSTGIVMIAGQVLTDVVAVAAGGSHSLGLKRDGTVVIWGRSYGTATITKFGYVISRQINGAYSCGKE